MAELPTMVRDLALILIVAGLVTLVFKRLKQPLVLGYIVAGFLVSTHMPYTMSVVDAENVQVWADIGVMFLLFSLGLDFSFKKIIKLGPGPAITTVTVIFSMMTLGVCVGYAFGWQRMDCIFLGGMLAMSSTTIIYKAFSDMGLHQQKFAGVVMGVLIMEDILAIVMMVMLTAVAQGKGADGSQMLFSVFKIVFFLVLWFVVGIFFLPWLLRRVRSLMNSETLLIVALGLCCLMAVVSTQVGFSSAFGAFVMGSILAETIEAKKIIRLVEPVKDLFGAIFFVSVGMLVDPEVLVRYALPIVALILTIIVGQAVFGSFAYLLGGQSLRSAMRCGFSMAQIGEFSFIIASLGLGLGVISAYLYPVVVAVSVITTFLTPYMIKFATPAYSWLERHIPKRWIVRLNRLSVSYSTTDTDEHHWRRLIREMAVYTVVYSILTAATIFLMLSLLLPFLMKLMPAMWARLLCGLITLLFISPFLRAIMMKKNHSEEFRALWVENRHNRLPLLFTIGLRVAIAVAFIFYLTNYLTDFSSAILLSLGIALVALIILSRTIKHRSIKLERMFVLNLRSRDIEAQVLGLRRPLYEGRLLDRDVHIADFEVPIDSLWAGRTLAQLNVGALYGVQVSSILRAGRRINIPAGDSIIHPLDKLQVIGTDEQLSVFAKALEMECFEQDAELEKREMRLLSIVVGNSSPLAGTTLAESGIRDKYNCMVVGLEEGKENLSHVAPDYQFKNGDIIWVVGEEEDLRRLQK